MADSPHALDLTTESRKTVRIDGIPYELRTDDDISVGQWRRFARIWNRILTIENQDREITKADEVEAMTLLREGVAIALIGITPTVLERLGYAKCSQVIAVFMKLSGRGLTFVRATPMPEAPPAATSPASPGTTSSPGSAASTAATRSRGKRPSR